MTLETTDMLLVDDEFCAGKDPKEAIADWCYRDLEGKAILDVGGGDGTDFWRRTNDGVYAAIDLDYTRLDWYDFESNRVWDQVIANDLFPNVDQRLEMFLEKFLPRCKKMRLSLTFFDKPKWYRARREEGELLTVKAFSSYELLDALPPMAYESYQKIAPMLDTELFPKSVFPNGRQVLLIELDGKATQATT
jgi:hypothetical protein